MLNRRVPTIFALLILIVGFLSGLFGLTQFQSLTSKATLANHPSRVAFSNFMNNSFSVSWTTEEETTGMIFLENEKNFFGDDREGKNKGVQKFLSHYITISKIPSYDNTFFFTIMSGTAKYGSTHENNFYLTYVPDNDICEINDMPGVPRGCFPFRLKIPPTLGANTLARGPISGVVFHSDAKTPVSDGVVYFSFAGSSISSTTLREDGTWIVLLGGLRTQDLRGYFTSEAGSPFFFSVYSGKEKLTFSCNGIDLASYAFPPLVFGKSFSCQIGNP